MAEVQGTEKLFSVEARKKFGHPGDTHLMGMGGIYRMTKVKDRRVCQRLPYYEPTNPQTAEQQAWRANFANAVAAWQNLTEEQKDVYNEKAKGKNYSGYNLFLSQFLLSG